MEIKLTWKEPTSQEEQQQTFALPLAIGREIVRLPDTYNGQQLTKACMKIIIEIGLFP